MQDRDRGWWLMLVIGLAFCAGGAVTPYLGARIMPANDPFMTSADYWQLIGMFGLLMLVCIGGGVTCVAMAVRARRRHLTRLAALRGDERVIPLAEIHPDPALAPDVAQKPLELTWRTGTISRVVYVPLLGLYAVTMLVTVGVMIFGMVAPFFSSPQPSAADVLSQTPYPMSIAGIAFRVAVAFVALALGAGTSVLCVRAIPHLLGRPFGVSATSTGVDARTELGAQVHIAWHEMRLLEVEIANARADRRFALYAPGKHIGWTEYTTGLGAQYVPVDATATEMALRHAALLSLIAARTGLFPRTLAKAPARATKRSSNVVAVLVIALIVAGITAADILFPVTPFSWVNWASAGSLALATVFLVIASLRVALARNTLPMHATPPSVGAPLLDGSRVVYSLRWRTSFRRRLSIGSIGLCLAINLIPGPWALLLQYVRVFPGFDTQVLPDSVFGPMGHYLLAFVLGVVGMAGLALVYAGVMVATTCILADSNGLTASFGGRERLMTWSSVQDISWGLGASGQFVYIVQGDVPTFQMSWLAGPQVANAMPPNDGEIPIGPDELAALVAARIGKPLRVREQA